MDKWGKTTHVIVKRISDGPMYVVKPVNASIHIAPYTDLFLPCGFHPIDVAPEDKTNTKEKNLRSRKVSELEND